MSDEELERIRQKKVQQLLNVAKEKELREKRMEELKQSEEAPKNVTEQDKLQLMSYFLTPDAYEYWKILYDAPQKKQTADTIFLNVLYLIKIGYLEGQQISRIGVKKLERKIEGIPSSITIKRKGEKDES